MDWYNILYVIIGGLLTMFGGIATQLVSNFHNNKMYKREMQDEKEKMLLEKKEKFFIEIVDTITMVVAEKTLTYETSERVNNLKSKFILYMDVSWCEKYWELVGELLDKKGNENYHARETTNKFYEELKGVLFGKHDAI